MKTLIIFAFFLSLIPALFSQETDDPARAWTNKDGKTIFAQFVEANDETVTISVRGQRHVLKLADLSEKSQRLATELQGAPCPRTRAHAQGSGIAQAHISHPVSRPTAVLARGGNGGREAQKGEGGLHSRTARGHSHANCVFSPAIET